MGDSRTALATLFRTAGKAHHHAFAATNGDDPAWPEWYAGYLALPLGELLGTTLLGETLGDELRLVDAEVQARAPSVEWPLYYADWFLARYPGSSLSSAGLPS